MLFWVSLSAGLAIVALTVVVAMFRAERRARRALYRALDFSEGTVEMLMSRNGDVRAQLTLVRISPPPAPQVIESAEPASQAPEPSPAPRHPTIRLVHPIAGKAETPAGDKESPNSARNGGA